MTSQDNTAQALIINALDERDRARAERAGASGQTLVDMGTFTHDGSGWIHDPTITSDQFHRMVAHAPKPRRVRKPRPATDIKRIEKDTGKTVIGVSLAEDGSVSAYTFDSSTKAEAEPTTTADNELERWRRKHAR